ncbi:MAG: VWA domain-containing protein, partial [Deltaproteobacteria bacterium]|nr:VWA domain-containing protein [Deltaproteobacteria bacterium]
GHVASLLDQERPNIFTQSVANIMPGERVVITIKYAEILPYEDGSFRFVFPMVVGPRFIPGTPTGRQGTGWAPDTTAVPDASRITPRVTPEGTRAGHDIDLTVSIDAGVPIVKIDSRLHEIDVQRSGEKRATVSLKNKKEIPNRDFVLTYDVAGEEVRSGVLAHRDGKEGFLTVIMIPPKRARPEQIAPKEMIFVIDCSGSQMGKPLEKAKEAMRYVIDHMNPEDTFNIIDFNVGARALFETPKKNTPENRARALQYLESLQARGGTWMGPAVETVCKAPAPENRLRIVTFMTDGYVGNDFEIISLVKNLRGKSRWFPFGTGNSVNRFLLDQMARVGGGEVDYVLLNSSAEEVGKKFYQRIASPVLTDITMSHQGVELEEVFPESLSDLWDRKPLIFKAKYSKPGKGTITIKGMSAGKPYEQKLDLVLPEKEPGNSALASIWARAKVDDLMDRDWMGAQKGSPDPSIKEEIVRVALAHRIMTQFTSFVAVEDAVVTIGGKPTTVSVPVEMPDGVSREGVFGDLSSTVGAVGAAKILAPASPLARSKRSFMNAAVESSAAPATSPGSAPQSADALKTGEMASLKETPRRRDLQEEESAAAAYHQESKASALQTKLSPELYELHRLFKAQKPGGNLTHGKIKVTDGKITVQVLLAGITDELVKKLEKAGLTVEFKATGGKTVVGVIAVDKLEELVSLSEVTSVKPV